MTGPRMGVRGRAAGWGIRRDEERHHVSCLRYAQIIWDFVVIDMLTTLEIVKSGGWHVLTAKAATIYANLPR